MAALTDREPIDHVLRVMEAIRSGSLGREPAGEWLLAGLEAHLLDGEPLERALGLGGVQSQHSAAGRYRRALRDEHLRQAFRLCEGATPWAQAGALRGEMLRFEAIVWPRWRDLVEPPASASDLRVQLWKARKLDKLPMSQRAIQYICCD